MRYAEAVFNPTIIFVSATELEPPALPALDDTEALLNWHKIESVVSGICASRTGRRSYRVLRLFRGLLLGVWYGLWDERLAQWP